MITHTILTQKKGVVNPLSYIQLLSGKDVTVDEISGHIVVTNVPVKILLKDTISAGITEGIDERIEARLGSVGLPTTIKDLKEVITHSGNVVAVQVYFAGVILLDELYTGVRRLPVDRVVNCCDHLCFDLTHWRSFV